MIKSLPEIGYLSSWGIKWYLSGPLETLGPRASRGPRKYHFKTLLGGVRGVPEGWIPGRFSARLDHKTKQVRCENKQ